jgi:hypothetical protein
LFNKKGIEKLEFNLNSHLKYQEYLSSNEQYKSDPFVQIKISKERIQEIYYSKNNPISDEGKNKSAIDNLIKARDEEGLIKEGFILKKVSERLFLDCLVEYDMKSGKVAYLFLSTDKDKKKDGEFSEGTIASVFCIIPDESQNECFNLYHGPIKLLEKGIWKDYTGYDSIISFIEKPSEINEEKASNFCALTSGERLSQLLSGINHSQVKEIFKESIFSTLEDWPQTEFYPVMGVCNPMAKKDNEYTYQHTVTGDFDLFALWPVNSLDNNATLIRKCYYGENNLAKFEIDIFFKINQSERVSLKTVIEFIPHITELKEKEDKDLGNYHKLGQSKWTLINQIAAKKESRKFPLAVHSDEGGRPAQNEIELPIVAFIPEGMGTTITGATSGIQAINNVSDFIDFLSNTMGAMQAKKTCEFNLILNHSWAFHLLLLVQFDDSLIDVSPGKDNSGKPDKDLCENIIKFKEKYSKALETTYSQIENNDYKSFEDFTEIVRRKILKLFFKQDDIEKLYRCLFNKNINEREQKVKIYFNWFVYYLSEYTLSHNILAYEGYVQVKLQHSHILLFVNNLQYPE